MRPFLSRIDGALCLPIRMGSLPIHMGSATLKAVGAEAVNSREMGY